MAAPPMDENVRRDCRPTLARTCMYCTYIYIHVFPAQTPHFGEVPYLYTRSVPSLSCLFPTDGVKLPSYARKTRAVSEPFCLLLSVCRTKDAYINHVSCPLWPRWYCSKTAVKFQERLIGLFCSSPEHLSTPLQQKMRASAFVALVAVLVTGSSNALHLLKRDGPSSFDRPIYYDLKRRAFLQPRADPKTLGLEIKATVRLKSAIFVCEGLTVAVYCVGY